MARPPRRPLPGAARGRPVRGQEWIRKSARGSRSRREGLEYRQWRTIFP
jgi:hypothetical protein